MTKLTKYLILIVVFLASCSKNDPSPNVPLPTDLSVNINVSNDGSGKVMVTATATNADYFNFDFKDPAAPWVVKDDDGSVDHVYSESGTYNINVKAYNTEDAYIEKEMSIQVTVNFIPTEGYTSPEAYAGYTLVWRDEFNSSSLDLNDWKFETGTGSNGWGNNELQYYRKENTSIVDGNLVIEAKKESFSGRNYTSSRIITMGKKSFKYGRVDIRAALPQGQGIWPALWMLGSNISTVGWPKCGEIDIMELIGGSGKDNIIHGTAHWDSNGNHASYGNSYRLPTGIFANKFHVFSIVWDNTKIQWLINDQEYNVIDITPADLDEFQQDFFFIFNVAVGGDWPGSPDGSTLFPQRMIVDYIRVFQK